jgi:hypothetical protein
MRSQQITLTILLNSSEIRSSAQLATRALAINSHSYEVSKTSFIPDLDAVTGYYLIFVYFLINIFNFCYILRKITTVDRLYLKGVSMQFAYHAEIFDYSLRLCINHCHLDYNPKSLVSSRIHCYACVRCS